MNITVNTDRMYDISMPIEEGMKVYKGKTDKKPRISLYSDFKTGPPMRAFFCEPPYRTY